MNPLLYPLMLSAGVAYGQWAQTGRPAQAAVPSAPLAAAGASTSSELRGTWASAPIGRATLVPQTPLTAIRLAPSVPSGLARRLAAGLDGAVLFDGAGLFGGLVDPSAVRAAFLAGARAGAEPEPASPQGAQRSPAEPPAPSAIPGRTPLEKHAAFFDRDGDGVITVGETRSSLRELGLGRARAAAVAAFIHLGLSASTADSWRDVALLRIRIGNIHKGIHPSDTGIYDAQGRFVPEAFDRVFDRFSKSQAGRLNALELVTMIEANSKRRPGALGKIGAKGEFSLLLSVAADGVDTVNGKKVPSISRERLSQLYDGTLFYRLSGRRS